MSSVLPVPGALFMLPSRILSPAIVHTPLESELTDRVLRLVGRFGSGTIICLIQNSSLVAP